MAWLDDLSPEEIQLKVASDSFDCAVSLLYLTRLVREFLGEQPEADDPRLNAFLMACGELVGKTTVPDIARLAAVALCAMSDESVQEALGVQRLMMATAERVMGNTDEDLY